MKSQLSQFKGERLKQARILRMLTGTELAALVSDKKVIKQQQISYWESNKRTPDFEDIKRLSEVLRVPYYYFLKGDLQKKVETANFFRRNAAVPTRNKNSMQELIYLYDEFLRVISRHIRVPDFKDFDLIISSDEFRLIDVNEIEELSKSVRRKYNLGIGPISNMTLLMERMGIRVIFSNDDISGIDALTKVVDGQFYVIINTKGKSSVRIRFSLAHELGHVFLHSRYSESVLKSTERNKRIESEAQAFASSFLMPEEGILMDMVATNLDFLKSLKAHWLVSIQAIAMRGKQIGLLTQSGMTYVFQQISRNGWRKSEPLDDTIPIEYPTFIKTVLKYFDSEGISIGEDLYQEGLSFTLLNSLFSSIQEPENKKNTKLRLI
ncbi:XRE family transcriptional regulator [Levilactobacillus brevis]|uniref:XRE family transcriptional regulator n=1 Tax=Levilactobacillus brevis TaxID=1580 RepID=A0AB38X777_LEVBR|nr:XRE family transcriptional regulator [Levilactobacillus brevis]WAD02568.1 XRE family transcriptional regulator [Levilactobacillus brevis]